MKLSIQSIPAFLLLLALAACGGKNTEATAEADSTKQDSAATNEVTLTNAQYQVAGIVLGSIEMKEISGTFKVNGMLDVPPQQQLSISIPVGGFLRKTDLLQGMFVHKGQLIASIENPDFIGMQQDYLDARSQLEYAKADYDRQQELARENVNARKTLQQAKATYYSLQAKVQGLRERIKVSGLNLAAVERGNIQSGINVYAPISGYVTQVNANLGKFINPTDVLFEIVDTRHLHAELTVFEKDIPKLKIGQTVRFTLANETKERTAKVYLIGREIDSDRTVNIHCHIDVEDNQMIPGTYLKALVETGANEVPALPNEAIVDFEGEKYIFMKAEGELKDTAGIAHFRMIPVQTGNSELNYTEIILPGTVAPAMNRIVIKGAYALLGKLKNSEEEE